MVLTDELAGWPGSVHDSRVLRNSSLYATPNGKFPCDYHLIGDGGHPGGNLIKILVRFLIRFLLRSYLTS